MLHLIRAVTICLSSLFSLTTSPILAAPVVDQECLPEYWGSYSIALGAPMGQEFVPRVAVLSFVDLWVMNEPASNNDVATLLVVIRADSLGGAEVGRSGEVAIPKPYHGESRFEFVPPADLEPGRKYVIEALRTEGPGNPHLLWGDQAGSCPGVTAYWQGRPFVGGGDFWYRTGYDPVSVRQVTWGTVKGTLQTKEPVSNRSRP